MTEAEAKTKWCPFAMSAAEGFAANRDYMGKPDLGAKCLGSECMTWRWGGKRLPNTSYEPIEGWQHVGIEEAEQCGETREFWREPEADAEKRRPGWCGLAGRPA